MSRTDAYFHFPIAIFQEHRSIDALVEDIKALAARKVGMKIYTEDQHAISAIVNEYIQSNAVPEDFEHKNISQGLMLVGAVRLGISFHSIVWAMKRSNQLHYECNANSTQCRIRSDIAQSAVDNRWPLAKFKVLCAIIAAIGDKPFKRLTYRMFRALGAGFNSPLQCDEEEMLSRSTVARWVDILWTENFIRRTSDGKDFWFSIRHENDRKLAIAVKRSLASKQSKKRVTLNDISLHEMQEKEWDGK